MLGALAALTKTKTFATRSIVERRANAINKLTQHLQDVYEGVFERVLDLPHRLPSQMLKVLTTLERTHGPEVAHDAVCLLMCATEGLTEEEIKALLHIDERMWRGARKILQPLLREVPSTSDDGEQGYPRYSLDASILFPRTVRLTGAVLEAGAEAAGDVAEDADESQMDVGGRRESKDDAMLRKGSFRTRPASAQSMSMRSISTGGGAAASTDGPGDDTALKYGGMTLRETIDMCARDAWARVTNKCKQMYHVALASFFAARALGMTIGAASLKLETGAAFVMVKPTGTTDSMLYAQAGHTALSDSSGDEKDHGSGSDDDDYAEDDEARAAEVVANSDHGKQAESVGTVGMRFVLKAPPPKRLTTRQAREKANPIKRKKLKPTGSMYNRAAAMAAAEQHRALKKRTAFLWNALRSKLAEGVSIRRQHRERFRRGCAIIGALFREQRLGVPSAAGPPRPTVGKMRVARGRGKGATLVWAGRVGRWVYGEVETRVALISLPRHLLRSNRFREAYAVLTDPHYVEAMAREGLEAIFLLVNELQLMRLRLDEQRIKLKKDMALGSRAAEGKSLRELLGKGGLAKLILALSDIEHGGAAGGANGAALAGFGARLKLRDLQKRFDAIDAMAAFVRSDPHRLVDYPTLTFQTVANLPDYSPLAAIAGRMWNGMVENRPFLRWVNKPTHPSPCIMTLQATKDKQKLLCAQYSDDGRFIAAGTERGSVVIVNSASGSIATTFVSENEAAAKTAEDELRSRYEEHQQRTSKSSKSSPPRDGDESGGSWGAGSPVAAARSPVAAQAGDKVLTSEAALEKNISLLYKSLPAATALAWRPGVAASAADGSAGGHGDAEVGAAGDHKLRLNVGDERVARLSGSGRYLVVGDSAGALWLWDRSVLAYKEIVRAPHEDDGPPLEKEEQHWSTTRQRRVRRGNEMTSVEISRQRTRAHAARVTSVAWSVDANMLLTGDEIGIVVLWKFPPEQSEVFDTLHESQPKTLMRWSAHESPVRNLRFAHPEFSPKVEADGWLEETGSMVTVQGDSTGNSHLMGASLSMSSAFATLPLRMAHAVPKPGSKKPREKKRRRRSRRASAAGDDDARSVASDVSNASSAKSIALDIEVDMHATMSGNFAQSIQQHGAVGAVYKSHRRTMFHVTPVIHAAPADAHHDIEIGRGSMPKHPRPPESMGLQGIRAAEGAVVARPELTARISKASREAQGFEARAKERREAARRRKQNRAAAARRAALDAIQPKSAIAKKWALAGKRGSASRPSTASQRSRAQPALEPIARPAGPSTAGDDTVRVPQSHAMNKVGSTESKGAEPRGSATAAAGRGGQVSASRPTSAGPRISSRSRFGTKVVPPPKHASAPNPESDSSGDEMPAERLGSDLIVVTSGANTVYLWRLHSNFTCGRQIGQTAGTALAIRAEARQISISLQRSNKIAKIVRTTGERVPLAEADSAKMIDSDFSPVRRRCATIFRDKSVRVFRTDNGKRVGVMHGHLGQINTVSYSPDGVSVVTASDDGTLRVWNPTLIQQGVLKSEAVDVTVSATHTPTDEGIVGGQVALVKRTGEVYIRDSHSAAFMGKHEAIVDFGSNVLGARYVDGGRRLVVVTSGGVRLWAPRPMEAAPLGDSARDLAAENTIALWAVDSACNVLAFTDVDGLGGIHTMDTLTGRIRAKFAQSRSAGMHLMQFTRDSRFIVTAEQSVGRVTFWDAAHGRYAAGASAGTRHKDELLGSKAGGKRAGGMASWDRKPFLELADTRATSQAATFYIKIEFAPDMVHCMLLSKDPLGTFTVWNTVEAAKNRDRKTHIAESTAESTLRYFGHDGQVLDGVWSPDQRSMATCGADGNLIVWDVHGQDIRFKFAAHGGRAVHTVQWTAQNDRIFTSGSDATVRAWAVADMDPLCVWLSPLLPTAVSISRMGTLGLIATAGGGLVLLKYEYQPGYGTHDTAIPDDVEPAESFGIASHKRAVARGGRFHAATRDQKHTGRVSGASMRFSSDATDVPCITPIRTYALDRNAWNSKVIFTCVYCGSTFQAYLQLLSRIDAVAAKLQKFGPNPSYYNDPKLLTRCLQCKKTHRVTPFYIDNPFKLK